MSKAKKIVKKEVSGNVPNKIEIGIPEGMKASDLSVEKRNELFIKAYQKFETESADTFGMKIGCQLVYSPQGLVPRLVTVDLLQKDETKNPKQETKV